MGRKRSIIVIELIVNHDGKTWMARNDWLSAKAPTLEELDNELKRLVKQKGYLEPGNKIDLFMAFDNSTIPQWMRQYGQHYFNRIVRLEN
jgi:leucyl-tRNA synthetase